MLLEELNKLSKKLEATKDKKVWKEVDERMGVVQTALNKAEASIARNEAHLEESRIQEEEVCQGDQGQSDSSEEQEDDIMVDQKRVAPLVQSPPTPLETKRQSPLWRSMWMTSHHWPQIVQLQSPPRRMRCSQAIPPQWLERWPSYRSPPLTALSLRTVKPNSGSLLNVLVRHST